MKWYRSIAVVLACFALAFVSAAAQEEVADAPAASDTTQAEPTSAPHELGTVYLEEVGGKWVATQAGSIEEYLKDRDRLLGLTGEWHLPSDAFRSLSATGRVVGNRVDLTVKLHIVIETKREEWLRIPLRFDEAVLLEVPKAVDASRYRLGLEPVEATEEAEGATTSRSGYVLWLRGDGEGANEEVELKFSVPLSERHLVLSVPRAVVSELRLTVPIAKAEAEAAAGTDLQLEENGDAATNLVLRGFRGEIDVTWRGPNGKNAEQSRVLQAIGTIIDATVDRHRVVYSAKLNVNLVLPEGRELSRFLVRLPSGAILAQEEYPTYSVTEVAAAKTVEVAPSDDERDSSSESGPAGSPDTEPVPADGRLVEVVLGRPVGNSEPASVILSATSDTTVNGLFQLAGFDVVGAAKQTGYVIVHGGDNWNVRCEEGRGVFPTSEVPGVSLSDDVIAAYRYFDQPFKLSAHALPKQVRIHVEPHYQLSIDSSTARLVGTLKYSVLGDKTVELRIDPKKWNFETVGPEQMVVIPDQWKTDKSGQLTIGLREGKLNEFELSFVARQVIDPTAPVLELALPEPSATSSISTTVDVFPADNIELREDWGKMTGLERRTVPPPSSFELPESQQAPLYYRAETGEPGVSDEANQAVFAAAMTIREQEISAESETEIRISSSVASVRQTIDFEVKYAPTDALTIRAPREFPVEYALDGEAIAAVSSNAVSDGDTVLQKVLLPRPRKGRLELTASFDVPIPKLDPQTSQPCMIPLIVPDAGTFVGHRARASVDEGIGIWLRLGSPWQEVLDGGAGQVAESERTFAVNTPETRIDLGVLLIDPDTFGSAAVEAAWIQTRMSAGQRRDRAVYRLVSNRKTLKLSLPPGVDTERLQVSLDGESCKYSLTDQTLTIALPLNASSGARVLELQYFTKTRPARGEMQIEFPRFDKDVWTNGTYLQLVLPRDEHLISSPENYTAEYGWGWTGMWWGRIPRMEQPDLEAWVMTDAGIPVSDKTSRYLFSKFGPAESVEVVTASRTMIVGAASALALLIGLVLIYIPAMRHPVFGMLLVVAVGAAAVVWPGAALLCAQAAGMGLVLSLMGAILYRGVAKRRRRTIRRDGTSSVFERGSTQAQFGSSEVEILRSTATEHDADAVQTPQR